jgi:hypothetical protein
VNLTNISRLLAVTLFTTEALKKKERVLSWLEAPDPAKTHNRLLEEHHEGTGKWFLNLEKYERWKETPCGILWIRGIRAFPVISSTGLGTHW